ncbi:hypothetical protein [Microtetraspora malaysiensis]|uniref:hypothetical protein n=1 Tax=Microtetraspora malaysiensis TaxID=161358 RepID=UPI000829E33E|nr:hypothetical protein [Microtetraspora malaysiensis]
MTRGPRPHRDAVGEFADLRDDMPAAGYFAVFEGVLGVAAVELAMMSLRYRRRVRPSAFRTGISLVGTAAAVSLVNVGYNLVYLVGIMIDSARFGEPAVPPDRGRVRLRGGGTVAEEIAILSGVSRALASSSLVRRSALASDGGTR